MQRPCTGACSCALAQQLHGRSAERSKVCFVDAGERIDEQRRPQAAQIQHHRRLLRRARNFCGQFDRRCGSRADTSRPPACAAANADRDSSGSCVPAFVFLRPLPSRERALALRPARPTSCRCASRQIALHLICRNRARRARASFPPTHASSRCARRSHVPSLAQRCDQGRRIEIARARPAADGVADRQTDERAFVARHRSSTARTATDAALAPRRTNSTCSSVSGIARPAPRRARIAATGSAADRAPRRWPARCESDDSRSSCRCGRCRRDNGRRRSARRPARRRSASRIRPCAPATRASRDRGSASADSGCAAR